MPPQTQKHILRQMFDVRPVKKTGGLDWERIRRVGQSGHEGSANIPETSKRPELLPIPRYVPSSQIPTAQKSPPSLHNFAPILPRSTVSPERLTWTPPAHTQPMAGSAASKPASPSASPGATSGGAFQTGNPPRRIVLAAHPVSEPRIVAKAPRNAGKGRKVLKRLSLAVLVACLLVGSGVGILNVYHKALKTKGLVLGVTEEGYTALAIAVESVKQKDFEHGAIQFDQAYRNFSRASNELAEWNATLIDLSRFIPGASKLASGRNVVEAGLAIAAAGQKVNGVLATILEVKNPLDSNQRNNLSFLDIFANVRESANGVMEDLAAAQTALDKVRLEDVPEEKQARFLQVREELPKITAWSGSFLEHSSIFSELLGGNGPRKYLFLFQNNQEMRATGGFIGSYGLLDVKDGHIRRFFVDGIFNPDGQLKESIVPPEPLQKVSAAWSLHDSNWWPDFPTSAEQAIFFYEKTGGPTVDGVITLTPAVMKKLLGLTGPIEMPEYNVVLDANNFLENIQYEVEVDYDKRENQPKKILADLAPLLLERLFNTSDPKKLIAALTAFEEGLRERHILLYSRDHSIEQLIDAQGWSGKILPAEKDYLSVINTNINGYKTDGVVEETIRHEAAIDDTGSVMDTVTVTRKHTGGTTPYEWWNKVNADYMRVYVPKGSRLLSVEGTTREFTTAPLDYDKLRFKRDPGVVTQESAMTIDEKTGTRMYEEAGKTVFANWVYVSPQETVTVKYTYLLPFKIVPNETRDKLNTYAILFQKQAGSVGSLLESRVAYPESWRSTWQSRGDLIQSQSGWQWKGNLKTDQSFSLILGQK